MKILAGVALLFSMSIAAAHAQKAFQPPSGPTPKTAEGKVDFSGVWSRPYVPDMTKDGREQKGMAELPYTPWGESEWKHYDPSEGDYTGACLPFGLTRSVNAPEPIQIMQNATYFTFLFEVNNLFVVVPIDGRPHRKVNPGWYGDSIGRWDGDTLVIDSINFNGRTKLDTVGHPMSDQLHVVQRYTRTDLGHIAFEMTVDDPKTYSKPWKNTRTFTLRPDWEMMEYSCEENNKSLWEGRIKVPKF